MTIEEKLKRLLEPCLLEPVFLDETLPFDWLWPEKIN